MRALLAKIAADESPVQLVTLPVSRLDIPFNFSTLCNHGAEQATGEVLLFLNNDVEIITADWLGAKLEQAQRPSIGAVGAMLLYEDGSVQLAGAILGLGGLVAHCHRGVAGTSPGYMHQILTINNYSPVASACLMCRREVFDQAGRFDEQLPGDYEDVDLRLKLVRAGYRNVYLPHVRLYHYEAATRGKDYVARDPEGRNHATRLMQARWPDFIAYVPCYSPNLTRDREDYGLCIEGVEVIGTRCQPRLDRFLICIDLAAAIDRRSVLLRGWALTLHGEAPARIEVEIEGRACGEATLGYAREDVKNAYAFAHSEFVWFNFARKLPTILPPRITMRITLSDARGATDSFSIRLEKAPAARNGLGARLRGVAKAVAAVAVDRAALSIARGLTGRPDLRLSGPRAGVEAAKLVSARLGIYKQLHRTSARVPGFADRLGLEVPLTADNTYRAWLWREYPRRRDLEAMHRRAAEFAYQPTISIFMPVCDIERPYLEQAIDSALAQRYPNFELCIADDASPSPHVRLLLESYAARDPRIKVTFRPTNGGISAACNSALGLATGEFVAQFDPRRSARAAGAVPGSSAPQPTSRGGFHLLRRGQDRPWPRAQPAVLQARLESRRLPYQDVHLPLRRVPALAG